MIKRKSTKVLITGAHGFIGRNLVVALRENHHFDVMSFGRGESDEKLYRQLSEADIVIHLAGENRPKSQDYFEITNVGLTKKIAENLKSLGKKTAIIFTSSVQVNLDNPYGKSKLSAEKILRSLSKLNGNPVTIFRLPGVFGKWCKHNYNSVVATFCHNIANGREVRIDDPNHIVRIAYIDDVIDLFKESLGEAKSGFHCKEVRSFYEISLSDLAAQIEAFEKSRGSQISESVGLGLVRALYATYVSYLPERKFSYEIPSHSDDRGVFVEMLKTPSCGQFSYFTAHPGITRGGHYHHTKTEKFLVLSGEAKFRFRHLISNEVVVIFTTGNVPKIVDTIPGWAHDITNIGKDDMIVMLWANEIFDISNPDTIASKV
jgi:UDP-2-acetamido-2,6-beta-L-arabino-hexul-4-ose reductase